MFICFFFFFIDDPFVIPTSGKKGAKSLKAEHFSIVSFHIIGFIFSVKMPEIMKRKAMTTVGEDNLLDRVATMKEKWTREQSELQYGVIFKSLVKIL